MVDRVFRNVFICIILQLILMIVINMLPFMCAVERVRASVCDSHPTKVFMQSVNLLTQSR